MSIALDQLILHLKRTNESVALELAHGPFELGSVVVHDGVLWHAEVPGARGDEAWSLLRGVTALVAHPRDIGRAAVPARTIKEADDELKEVRLEADMARDIESARANRVILLGAAEPGRAPAEQVSRLSLPPAPVPTGPGDSDTILDDASQQAYEQLFRAGTQAYLKHDFASALESFTACGRLRPNDKRVLHNLERLKVRMHSGSS